MQDKIKAKKATPKNKTLGSQTGAWSGRFNEPVAALVKRYTASVDFDKRLAKFDIQGSMAHAQMHRRLMTEGEDLVFDRGGGS